MIFEQRSAEPVPAELREGQLRLRPDRPDGRQAQPLVLATAIDSLARLTHRGAVAADGKTGDGCGLLMKRPDGFLQAVAEEEGFQLAERFAVGCVFLSRDEAQADRRARASTPACEAQGLTVAGWRTVPTDAEACGEEALETLPRIEQVFVNAAADMDEARLRAQPVHRPPPGREGLDADGDQAFYIPSLSSRVLSYKGLMMPANLPVFYPDLNDERLETAICVFHQRFSTNTLPAVAPGPAVPLPGAQRRDQHHPGQPQLGHARASKFETPLLPDLEEIAPLVNSDGSDSSSLDNMLEVLLAGGMDMFRAMRLLIPPAWQNVDNMDPDLRAFYEYNSMHWSPGTVRPASCSPMAATRPACWTATACVRPAR